MSLNQRVLMFNSKQKKWALFSAIFFLVLSMDDYSVFSLSIPTLNQAKVNEGFLQIVPIGGKRGGGDMLSLWNDYHREKFRCRINSSDYSECISTLDERFYERTKGDGRSFFTKPKPIDKTKFARVWWYEASYFGPLKEKRLLQLDVGGVRIISYQQQKAKYLLKKNNHAYILTVLLVISVIYFCLLQLVNQSLKIKKEK